MNFFKSDISLIQAEKQLEDYILNYPSSEFHFKNIPLTEDDKILVSRLIRDYSKSVYSFDDYDDVLLLFIVDGYILSQTLDLAGVITTLFFKNSSHIPQHHIRHLVYMLVNVFIEFGISTFGMKCNSLEDIIKIIQRHTEI